ncbi:hypothetical protein DEAC_c24100 [Desulfosporosinus acididurans]|uniref:Uncharacterized protein n=1 Tax=Desulfosporosinus acididurans TaxID=476652 RepID=A0A0J1FQJ9_9FIRM|nr:hypothetical protein DEAC_c24100 [Desulfosporosinus acididurans]
MNFLEIAGIAMDLDEDIIVRTRESGFSIEVIIQSLRLRTDI